MNWTIRAFSVNQQRRNPGAPNTDIVGLVSECGTWGIAHIPPIDWGGDCFFTVTHIPSGMKSNTHAESLTEAERYCVEMNARGDWSGDLALELDHKKGCARSGDVKFAAMAVAHAETMKILVAARESTGDRPQNPDVQSTGVVANKTATSNQNGSPEDAGGRE